MDGDEGGAPWWWGLVVAVAVVLGALWLLRVVIGALFGLLQVAILVVLSVAVIGWAVSRKRER